MCGVALPAGALARYIGTLPAFLVGFAAGVHLFGDQREFLHLLGNANMYRREFKMIRTELYYR